MFARNESLLIELVRKKGEKKCDENLELNNSGADETKASSAHQTTTKRGGKEGEDVGPILVVITWPKKEGGEALRLPRYRGEWR